LINRSRPTYSLETLRQHHNGVTRHSREGGIVKTGVEANIIDLSIALKGELQEVVRNPVIMIPLTPSLSKDSLKIK